MDNLPDATDDNLRLLGTEPPAVNPTNTAAESPADRKTLEAEWNAMKWTEFPYRGVRRVDTVRMQVKLSAAAQEFAEEEQELKFLAVCKVLNDEFGTTDCTFAEAMLVYSLIQDRHMILQKKTAMLVTLLTAIT